VNACSESTHLYTFTHLLQMISKRCQARLVQKFNYLYNILTLTTPIFLWGGGNKIN
jgi:hypothetical protein